MTIMRVIGSWMLRQLAHSPAIDFETPFTFQSLYSDLIVSEMEERVNRIKVVSIDKYYICKNVKTFQVYQIMFRIYTRAHENVKMLIDATAGPVLQARQITINL